MKTVMSGRLRRMNYMLSEINALYHEASCRLGVSDSIMMVLYSICCCGEGCMLSNIYKLSGTAKQTINSAIRKMEKDKLLYLENSGGKAKRVFLTESGRELAEKTAMPLIAAENSILEGWSEHEADLYGELQKKYIDDFRDRLKLLGERKYQ